MSEIKNKNLMNCSKNWYLGVFGIADYEFDVKFKKLKIADPISWKSFLKRANSIEN